MILRSRVLIAILLYCLTAIPCSAQRGIPPIRFSAPSPRVPIIHPVPIHGHNSANSTGHNSANTGSVDPLILYSIITVIAVLLVAIIVVLVVTRWTRQTVAHLRIYRTPPGEAPEAIRDAWVGVELPLRSWELRPKPHPTEGVLSRQIQGASLGYAVAGRAAIKVLARYSRDAAAWWRLNAPHVLVRGYRLWFPLDVFEPLEGLALGQDGTGGIWQREMAWWEKPATHTEQPLTATSSAPGSRPPEPAQCQEKT
jgi:hypothetical protein